MDQAVELREAEGWSPRRIQLLRVHHVQGLSAARSAELIGGVSRNAVISKRRRLGLRGEHPCAEPSPVRACAADKLRGFHRPPLFRCEPLPNMDFELPPGAAPKRLVDRAPGECAWPLGPAQEEGDYRTLFCCAPVAPRSAYCACHAGVSRGPG